LQESLTISSLELTVTVASVVSVIAAPVAVSVPVKVRALRIVALSSLAIVLASVNAILIALLIRHLRVVAATIAAIAPIIVLIAIAAVAIIIVLIAIAAIVAVAVAILRPPLRLHGSTGNDADAYHEQQCRYDSPDLATEIVIFHFANLRRLIWQSSCRFLAQCRALKIERNRI